MTVLLPNINLDTHTHTHTSQYYKAKTINATCSSDTARVGWHTFKVRMEMLMSHETIKSSSCCTHNGDVVVFLYRDEDSVWSITIKT